MKYLNDIFWNNQLLHTMHDADALYAGLSAVGHSFFAVPHPLRAVLFQKLRFKIILFIFTAKRSFFWILRAVNVQLQNFESGTFTLRSIQKKLRTPPRTAQCGCPDSFPKRPTHQRLEQYGKSSVYSISERSPAYSLFLTNIRPLNYLIFDWENFRK